MDTIWEAGRFIQAREELGKTVKDAALLLDITPEYLSMVENGHKVPSAKLINEMCEIYAKPAGFFLRNDQRVAQA